MIEIKISRDFSVIPGGRTIAEGNFSGEEFRDTILMRKYCEAEEQDTQLLINFDDCYGIGTSFLEEAFGGLVRVYHKHGVMDRIIIVATEDETIPENIKRFVEDAEAEEKKRYEQTTG